MDNLESQLQALFNNAAWTAKEHALFLELLDKHPASELQLFFQENYMARLSQIEPVDKAHAGQLLQAIHERLALGPAQAPLRALPPRRNYRWWAVAAVFILLTGLGIYLFILNKQATGKQPAIALAPKDIAAPAISRAMITLSNGQQVYLDSAAAGTLAQQGNVQITKDRNGKIAYSPAPSGEGRVGYNTLSNPRGSNVVNIVLSDGTHVWLNAASSIRYPVAFTGNEREVEITGEAYVEVVHDAARPFHVKARGQLIEDIGTAFNVNAYPDEPMVLTTLIEGSVQVSHADRSLLLNPGEQGVLNPVTGGLSKGVNTDIEQVLAWKNDRFAFHSADLGTVMRQLSRWYDVTVRYEGTIPDLRFNGRIGRTLTLDQVLKTLSNTGVHYRIEPGNQLIILP